MTDKERCKMLGYALDMLESDAVIVALHWARNDDPDLYDAYLTVKSFLIDAVKEAK